MIKKIIRTPKIFIISHRLDVTLWKYFTNSVCAASMFKYDESTLESILQRTATRACNKKVQNNNQFSLTHTHTRLTALFPGLPRWAGTRKVKPIWILRKQETVSGSGISWAICKSASCSRQITTPAPHHSVFTGRMPFLPPNQQRQSTEGNVTYYFIYSFTAIILMWSFKVRLYSYLFVCESVYHLYSSDIMIYKCAFFWCCYYLQHAGSLTILSKSISDIRCWSQKYHPYQQRYWNLQVSSTAIQW